MPNQSTTKTTKFKSLKNGDYFLSPGGNLYRKTARKEADRIAIMNGRKTPVMNVGCPPGMAVKKIEF